MTSMLRTSLGLAGLGLLVGCTGAAPTSDSEVLRDPPASANGASRSQPISPGQATDSPDSGITRCADVRLPEEGLGEADYFLDEAAGTLQINFSDLRRGRYRNVSYTVSYLADGTCLSTPGVTDAIDRAAPKDWPPSK